MQSHTHMIYDFLKLKQKFSELLKIVCLLVLHLHKFTHICIQLHLQFHLVHNQRTWFSDMIIVNYDNCFCGAAQLHLCAVLKRTVLISHASLSVLCLWQCCLSSLFVLLPHQPPWGFPPHFPILLWCLCSDTSWLMTESELDNRDLHSLITWQQLLGMQTWSRRSATVQNEHQNGEDRSFLWLWMWHGC